MTSCIHHVYKGAAVSKSKSEKYISSMKQAFKLNLYEKNKQKMFVLIRQKTACPRSDVEIMKHREKQWQL